MNLVHALVYGIVQGITAYLPISSDAHIRLVQVLLGWGADESPAFTAFTAVIQLGPTLAVIIYFRQEVIRAVGAFFGAIAGKVDQDSHDAKLGFAVFWGTIPICVLGVVLKQQIETTFRSLYVIGGSLIVIAFFMLYADRAKRHPRHVDSVQPKDGIIVGLWQCLALIPGVSRSGTTISASLLQGFARADAARFAFLMGIPSFSAAGLFELFEHYKRLLNHTYLVPLGIAFVVSFLVAYAWLAWFFKFIQKNGVTPFVVYRVVLGLVIIGLVLFKVVPPDAGAKPVQTGQDSEYGQLQQQAYVSKAS